MGDIYFDGFEEVINKELSKATNNVKIAVAWINFKMFGDLFNKLLAKGVKVKVIVNGDHINRRHQREIALLEKKGMKFKMLKMPTSRQFMHHKYCIVDGEVALLGSYNWTTNASRNNFENLLIIKERLIVNKLRSEFKYLESITTKKILKLQRVEKCEDCKSPQINICVLDQEGYYHTEVDIFENCECGHKKIYHNYDDVSLYNNLININDEFNDFVENEHVDIQEHGQIEAEYEYEVQRYLGSISNMVNVPIHAIGIRAEDDEDGERFIQILWKDRFVSKLIEDRYYYD